MTRSGPPMLFISAAFFALVGILVKISTAYLPAGEVAFVRFFSSFVIVLALARARVINLRFIDRPLLVARGMLGGAAQLLYFYSLSLIPLSDAILLSFTYPIFATLYSSFFLKEEAKGSVITALIFSFIGIFIVMNPAFKELNYGYFLALLSGALAGGAIVTIRKLRRTDSSWAVVYALGVGGIALSGILTIQDFVLPDLNLVLLLAIMGTIATLGQVLMAYAYKFCKAAEGSIISMSTVIFAVILGYFFLGETLSLSDIVGGSMVLGSAVYLIRSASSKKGQAVSALPS